MERKNYFYFFELIFSNLFFSGKIVFENAFFICCDHFFLQIFYFLYPYSKKKICPEPVEGQLLTVIVILLITITRSNYTTTNHNRTSR